MAVYDVQKRPLMPILTFVGGGEFPFLGGGGGKRIQLWKAEQPTVEKMQHLLFEDAVA